jgi:hypothetical protein
MKSAFVKTTADKMGRRLKGSESEDLPSENLINVAFGKKADDGCLKNNLLSF